MSTDDLNDQDENCWKIAIGKETFAGYSKYLRIMPQGRHVDEANMKIAAFLKVIEQTIENEWESAIAANSYYKVFDFTKRYPDSKFAPEYATKLKEYEQFKLIEDEAIKKHETDEQKAEKETYEFALNLMVNQNYSATATRESLINRGLDAKNANEIVTDLEDRIKDGKKQGAHRDLFWGAVWCFGGIKFTILSYSAASNGGVYYIFYGAIIYGVWRFLKGIIKSLF
ncbi:MAG: hypothetical protein WCP85_14975 [Mariniphaga sp.]